MSKAPAATDMEKSPDAHGSQHASHSGLHTPHHVALRVRERLRQFLHPNGKRIHVAASPEEADQLRRRLEQIHNDGEFDIYISGTPEHLDALRTAQTHHEDRREQLRQQHQAVYDRFADVHEQLDALANELDRVTTHGVSLEAHFSNYDDESPNLSGTSTPHAGGSINSSEKESACERGFRTPLKIFKVPALRQYFHKGILWRSSGSEEVQSFELFVDLLYVGILQIQGDYTSEDPTGLSLLYFIITFTLSYKIWNDMNLFISWFETDDLYQRVSILFLLACLFGYTTNIVDAFEHDTYATLIGFFLAARMYMGTYLTVVAHFIPMIRGIMIYHICIMLFAAALWIGSIHVEWPAQLGLIFSALFVDIFGQVGYFLVMMWSQYIGGKFQEKFDKAFEVFPAINIEHRTERTNAFVSLVFGYTVVALLYQSARNGIDAFYGKAILGLIQCFIYNWLYFEIDSSNLRMHAIRRHKFSAMAWSFAHLPFIMAFVLGGGGLARLVVAHDTKTSHIEWLTETYQERSEEEIPVGIRWFYCAGFGIALLFMAMISLSHIHRETEGVRLTKTYRIAARVSIAIILICLPLAERLNSLDLIGVVTGLLVVLLMTELWAASNAHEKLFGRDSPCRYTGRCSKGILHELIKSGDNIEVEKLVNDKQKDSGHTVGP